VKEAQRRSEARGVVSDETNGNTDKTAAVNDDGYQKLLGDPPINKPWYKTTNVDQAVSNAREKILQAAICKIKMDYFPAEAWQDCVYETFKRGIGSGPLRLGTVMTPN
jgi:hypothetical protein